jgi:hypothetical protein
LEIRAIGFAGKKAASVSEGRSRGLDLIYLAGVVGGGVGAGFFSRCGARSMWLALNQARIFSALRAYFTCMMASK